MRKCKVLLMGCFSFCLSNSVDAQKHPVYFDISKPVETRIKDFISQLTLDEKVGQMVYNSPAIPRLGIPAYNWWNEALHGVGRSGVATVFPQAIGLAATFDDSLANAESTVVSTEARAMYNAATAKGYHMKYGGLSFWTPNINIFRDPRWGRGQETYGEDPYLTSRMGVAFVKGLQGNDPKYLKVAACAKHYAVHSGPERLRHEFNAKPTDRDLWETYLPAFHSLVDAKVEAVMCAYNRTNDEPCCGNTYLLQDVLRKQWNFKGHIVTDCWAVTDFYEGHKVVKTAAEASALAVNKGVSLNCGSEFGDGLAKAVKDGLVTESRLDSMLTILLRTKMKLGLMDPVGSSPYDRIPATEINSAAHRALARTVAQKSIVMLKNNGVLPLRNDLRKYFLTGPNAANVDVLLGNYFGVNNNLVTFVEGISSALKPGSQMEYRPGTLLDRENINPIDWTTDEAKSTDATIVVLGISGLLEGEEGESIASPSFGDRLDYNLPKNQIEFLRKIKKNNDKPVIAVITGGSPMNLAEIHEIADAVLLVWYPGEEGGNALADVLFGKISPSGKLPVTFPKSLDQLPGYEDYSMQGRTYRYMKKEPLYPFGFGLSYTSFVYSNISTSAKQLKKGQSTQVSVQVKNTGRVDADEVVQVYVSAQNADALAPIYSLKSFKRISLKAGASRTLTFTLPTQAFEIANDKGEMNIVPGAYKISVAGSLPSQRSLDLGAAKSIETTIDMK